MKKFGRIAFFFAAVIGVCSIIGVAGAQLYPQMFSFVDVKVNGTRLHLFGNNGPKAHYLDFRTGATLNASTSALEVYGDWALPSPTPGPSNGTCLAADRNHTYTIQGGSGVKDLTYQCCHTTSNTYVWIAGYCQ